MKKTVGGTSRRPKRRQPAQEVFITDERAAALAAIDRSEEAGLSTTQVADAVGKSRQATLHLLKRLEHDRVITLTEGMWKRDNKF